MGGEGFSWVSPSATWNPRPTARPWFQDLLSPTLPLTPRLTARQDVPHKQRGRRT